MTDQRSGRDKPNPPPGGRGLRGCAGWAALVILIAIIVLVWVYVTNHGYKGERRNAPPPGLVGMQMPAIRDAATRLGSSKSSG